ncbi:MAG: alpha-galactosidase [Bacteroidales bacterium]|nr:alpha-galactosidase [Bacteroidales bacterium]
MKKVAFVVFLTLICLAGSHLHGQSRHVLPPAMGWSSWNAFGIGITDNTIMQQADLLVKTGLSAAGYKQVNIDDCFFGYRDADGFMTANTLRFPGGMEAVTDRIHRLGLKAGIYSDAGDNTCASKSAATKDPYGIGAGLWQHEAQDAQRYFNDWHFDFIKIDYCGGRNLKLYEPERYSYIKHIFDSVVTRPFSINICCWHYPGTWASQIGDSWRIGSDLIPSWESVCYMMKKNIYLSAYAGDGHYNDMDMLVVGFSNKASSLSKGSYLTKEEDEAHFGLWCIMSSPLILGCDLTYISPQTLEIVTNPELIAVNQDRLGLQAHVVQHEGAGYVLAKDLHKLRGKTRAVALYNPSDSDYHFAVAASFLELDGMLKIRDLTHRKDLGKDQHLFMDLPPHSATILSVKGQKRLEPIRYEAEWGFIPAYNDIPGYENAQYVEVQGASCQAGVSGLGGDKERCLQWNNIHRKKSGEYSLLICYKTDVNCPIELVVNGETKSETLWAYDGWSILRTKNNITLHKGYNSIQIGNDNAAIPAIIDYIELQPK